MCVVPISVRGFAALSFKVMIISGRDKGLTGTVTQVVRSRNRVIVEGRNLVSSRERERGREGGRENPNLVNLLFNSCCCES
jgi:hypothetical protein